MIDWSTLSKEDAKIFMESYNNINQPVRYEISNIIQSGTVLDIGCGKGFSVKERFTKSQYLGVDPSRELIKIAKKNNEGYNFKVMDETTLKIFKDDQFDYTIVQAVLEHVESVDKAQKIFHEAVRIGKTALIAWHMPPIYLKTEIIEISAELSNKINQNRYASDDFNFENYDIIKKRCGGFELWIVKKDY